jgi:hypothetical protein
MKTKQQTDAIDYIVMDIDELDNKPRRLFSSLRKIAEAFIEESDHYFDVIDSIDEFEKMYYTQIQMSSLVKEILDIKREISRELCGKKELQETEYENADYLDGYRHGVKKALEQLSLKITEAIIRGT